MFCDTCSTVLTDGMMERRNILIQEDAPYFRWIDAQGHDVISSRTCSVALVVGVVVVELSVSRFVDVARHGSFDGERARLRHTTAAKRERQRMCMRSFGTKST